MTPALGQRWQYIDSQFNFIVEIIKNDINLQMKLKAKILQIIYSAHSSYSVDQSLSLTTFAFAIDSFAEFTKLNYSWNYLPGQDKSNI